MENLLRYLINEQRRLIYEIQQDANKEDVFMSRELVEKIAVEKYINSLVVKIYQKEFEE